jgi:hypothetical protein
MAANPALVASVAVTTDGGFSERAWVEKDVSIDRYNTGDFVQLDFAGSGFVVVNACHPNAQARFR